MHSKDMYKPVFQVEWKVKVSDFDENNFICLNVFKVIIKENSIFMVNLFSNCHSIGDFDLLTTTADNTIEQVQLNRNYLLQCTMMWKTLKTDC